MRNIRLFQVYIILLASILFSTVNAQQTFRVYRTDGSMQVFFYSTLDSITFSPTDEAGIKYENGIIQYIHTTDSVYSFHTNEIDSIAFQPIPTVYKPEVVKIEGKLRDYVTGSDSLTLFVRTDIPDSLLPNIGSDIATLECDDILPYGFIGHVENINRADDSIKIECSRASLRDIFDSLCIEGTAVTGETAQPTSRSPIDVWPPIHENLVFPSLKGSISLSKELTNSETFTHQYEMSASAELKTDSAKIIFSYFLTPERPIIPREVWSFTLIAESSLSVSGSFGSATSFRKDFPFQSIRNIRVPVPAVAALFELFEEGGIFVEIEGELGLKSSYTKPFTTIIHMDHDNYAPYQSSIPPTFRIKGKDAISEAVIEGSAAVTLGLYGKIGVAAFAKEMADIEAELRAGGTFSTSYSHDLTKGIPPLENINTDVYDQLNCDDFYRVDLSLEGEISANVIGEAQLSRKLEFGDFLFKNPIFQRGAVPRFDKVKLTDSDKPGTLLASATLGRNLMFSTPVGFALYDNNKKFVDKWWSENEYKNEEGRELSHEFEGLKANTIYTLHPITHAFKDNFVANPSATGEIFPHIITGEADDITNTRATLKAQIKVSDGCEYTAGFYYYTVNGEKMEISTKGKGSKDLSLTISNLAENTNYQYYSFIKVGESIEVGEEKTFTTCWINNNIKPYVGSNVLDISASSLNFALLISAPYTEKRAMGISYYEEGGEIYTESDTVYTNVIYYTGIKNLKPDTKYYVYAFMKDGNELAVSDTQTFRTLREDDSENPIFEIKQLSVGNRKERNGNYLSSTQMIVTKGDNNLNGYIISKESSIKEPRVSNGIDLLNNNKFTFSVYEQEFYKNNFTATLINNYCYAILKYATENNPGECYHTKIPLNMYYDQKPNISDITTNIYSGDGYAVQFKLEGSMWISSVTIEAELWDTTYYYDEYGNRHSYDYKVEEKTFNITYNETKYNSLVDGNNEAVLWPRICNLPKIIIKNVSLNLE